MATSDDSRPFAALRQNAEEFKACFDEDIAQCLAVLDSRITALLCDQDTVADSFSDAKRLNAHMEFSKAKLDIFLNMKNLMNDMETSWAEQLADLKETFIENVEIFLAGTKLDVNFPEESPRIKKNRKGRLSSSFSPTSIYPTLIKTAKHIPVLNTFLSNADDEEDEQMVVKTSPQNERSPRKLSRSPLQRNEDLNTTRKKNSVRFVDEVMMEDEEQNELSTPMQKRTRQGKSAISTPASFKKAQALQTPVTSGNRGVRKSILSTPSSVTKSRASLTPLGMNKELASLKESNEEKSGTSSRMSRELASLMESEEKSESRPKKPAPRNRRGVQSQNSDETTTSVTPGRQTRTGSKRGAPNQSDVLQTETAKKGSKTPSPVKTAQATSLTPGRQTRTGSKRGAPNQSDVLQIETAGKRSKTPSPVKTAQDLVSTPGSIRNKSKRKTLGSLSDLSTSPKRLKKGRGSLANSSLALETSRAEDSGLWESDASEKDNYTPWISLADVGGKVPSQPGIYELKVVNAKKPAFIGSCESLQQKLTLHKLKHKSGHKHLDKFIERNAVNILVRYEKMTSLTEAKAEEKARVARCKPTPAYN